MHIRGIENLFCKYRPLYLVSMIGFLKSFKPVNYLFTGEPQLLWLNPDMGIRLQNLNKPNII